MLFLRARQQDGLGRDKPSPRGLAQLAHGAADHAGAPLDVLPSQGGRQQARQEAIREASGQAKRKREQQQACLHWH